MSRVLIIRGGAIGDFILTLPIFEAVHAEDPFAQIEVLGYEGIAQLAVGRRHAVAVRRVDGPEWAPLFAPDGNVAESEREYLSGFDQVVCVWPDENGVICANLERAGARKVIAVQPLPPGDRGVHAVEYMARQCGRAGLNVKYLEPQLFPSARDSSWADQYMRVTRAGERSLLGLHPGSGSPAKNWPAEGFAAVARYWIRRRGGHVLVVVGPADEGPLEDFRAQLDPEGVFILQNESLPRVAACLARCELFVGNDSGIAHMAAAVRVPTLVVFGRVGSRTWRPLGPRVRVVEPSGGSKSPKRLSASRRTKGGSRYGDGADMSGITAKEVIRQMGSLLRGD